jgi:hypothetical protein
MFWTARKASRPPHRHCSRRRLEVERASPTGPSLRSRFEGIGGRLHAPPGILGHLTREPGRLQRSARRASSWPSYERERAPRGPDDRFGLERYFRPSSSKANSASTPEAPLLRQARPP